MCFFFQAEDGIRDLTVTGVQTCALPISAGKDGTIRHVMGRPNAQGCRVTAFKRPSAEEADHDFLWRIHRAVPAKGDIAIFNRSHYEDVLVARVRKLVPREVWSARYEQINGFEALLAQNGVTVVKFFLHIDKAEQKRRFEERLQDPAQQGELRPQEFGDREKREDPNAALQEAHGPRTHGSA